MEASPTRLQAGPEGGPGSSLLLEKPFTTSALADAVRKAIDGD
jgi:hypothetical protein